MTGQMRSKDRGSAMAKDADPNLVAHLVLLVSPSAEPVYLWLKATGTIEPDRYVFIGVTTGVSKTSPRTAAAPSRSMYRRGNEPSNPQLPSKTQSRSSSVDQANAVKRGLVFDPVKRAQGDGPPETHESVIQSQRLATQHRPGTIEAKYLTIDNPDVRQEKISDPSLTAEESGGGDLDEEPRGRSRESTELHSRGVDVTVTDPLGRKTTSKTFKIVKGKKKPTRTAKSLRPKPPATPDVVERITDISVAQGLPMVSSSRRKLMLDILQYHYENTPSGWESIVEPTRRCCSHHGIYLASDTVRAGILRGQDDL